MNTTRRPFGRPAREQNANPNRPDLAARYARICADPLIWPLTAQVSASRNPLSFTRWFRRLIGPKG